MGGDDLRLDLILPPTERYEFMVDAYQDPQFSTGISVRTASVGGLPATVVENEVTEAGFWAVGTRICVYVVNLGGDALLPYTSGTPGEEYEANKTVIDAMAGALVFFSRAMTARFARPSVPGG